MPPIFFQLPLRVVAAGTVHRVVVAGEVPVVLEVGVVHVEPCSVVQISCVNDEKVKWKSSEKQLVKVVVAQQSST